MSKHVGNLGSGHTTHGTAHMPWKRHCVHRELSQHNTVGFGSHRNDVFYASPKRRCTYCCTRTFQTNQSLQTPIDVWKIIDQIISNPTNTMTRKMCWVRRNELHCSCTYNCASYCSTSCIHGYIHWLLRRHCIVAWKGSAYQPTQGCPQTNKAFYIDLWLLWPVLTAGLSSHKMSAVAYIPHNCSSSAVCWHSHMAPVVQTCADASLHHL